MNLRNWLLGPRNLNFFCIKNLDSPRNHPKFARLSEFFFLLVPSARLILVQRKGSGTATSFDAMPLS